MPRDTQTDILHRFLLDNCDIRGEIITLGDSLLAATAHQTLPPSVADLLGQFFTAVDLLANNFKFKGTLTLQVRGSGPVPLIMAEATDRLTHRGIVRLSEQQPLPEGPAPQLRDWFGDGVLTLTIDPDRGQRYQGIVPLEGDALGDCLSHYFSQSEQLPTRVWLHAHDGRAGGLLLQALPSQTSSEEDHWRTAETLAETLTAEELLTLEHSELLMRLFNEFEVRLFEAKPVAFACTCSRERSANALTSLGRDDAFALLAERQQIDMDCQFCGKHYTFGEADLINLFGPDQTPLH